MSAAQLLLRSLIEKAGGAEETGYLLVIDGEGLESLPEQMQTPKGAYRVHRVATELGLRHLLWKARGAPLIAVMPEDVARRIQKAPDLLRRAHKERIFALSVNEVLEAFLGVRVVGADAPHMQQLALEHVNQLGLVMSRRTLPTVVDRRLLTEMLVDVSVGEQVRTQSPAHLLAAWVQEPPHWPDNVRLLIRDALIPMHGDDGRLLSWALEEPERRLRELVVHGAVLTVDVQDPPKSAWGPLWQAATEAPIDLDRRILRRVVTRLAEGALNILGETAAPQLQQADRVARECLSPSQVETSHVLPLAFANRCHALAKQAADGKPISGPDIAWLAAHRAARMHRTSLAVLEAMGRLSRFLDQPFTPRTAILEQVLDYQRNGAFADLSILQLRRALASSAEHHKEANKVLAAARERRNLENRQFAEVLAAGYESSLHNPNLTPLHRLWKRTVAPVWETDPGARLYLVVLDGCSYPVFLELLHALAQDSTYPIGVRPDPAGRVGGMPALAPLPTITSHARGAIFLGELPKDPLVAETVFGEQDEARTDKARLNQNAALGPRSRKLFLKGDLADGGQALLGALADTSLDVVAAVFNAVDDQIGSANTGATVRLSPEDIAAFKPSLRGALNARRKILITADHGHSPYIDKNLRMSAGKTPRFLPLDKKSAPPTGFIEIDLASLGGPAERRAFAWQSGVYLGSPQVGFHGGCSLEEMVVPLAWLERDGLHADEPSWWYGQSTVVGPHTQPRPAEPSFVAPAPTVEVQPPLPQLTLFNPGDRADTLPLPPELLKRLSNDERSVLVLLRENGTARATELAERLKKNPVRLNGLMVTLRRTLHAEGITLFTDDRLPSGETIYRYQGKENR